MTEEHGCSDLRVIIAKLGHSLNEIRKRSLENIQSKLKNDIITYEELIHHRDLYIHLLHWLNEKDNVLSITQLLSQLSKYPAACVTLSELGAVDFFSLFRQDLVGEEEHVKYVDEILNNLFVVHDVQHKTPHLQTVPLKDFSAKTSSNNEIALEHIVSQYDLFKSGVSRRMEDTVSSDNSFPSITCNDESKEMTTKNETCIGEDISRVEASVTDTFLWISLTSGDRQILAVTNSRLQSSSVDLIIQSCDFLKGVLFHDFPAEVFIQRPNIISTLYDVIAMYKHQKIIVVKHAVCCLDGLCENLHKRLVENQNKDLWQQKQMSDDIPSLSVSTNRTESSNLSSVSAIKQQSSKNNSNKHTSMTPDNEKSTNQDDTGLHLDERYEDEDAFESTIVTEALYQAQYSVTKFLLSCISASVELLDLYINNNSLFSMVVTLHTNTIRILSMLSFNERWNTDYKEDKNLIYTLMTALHKLDTLVDKFTSADEQGTNLFEDKPLKAVIVCQIILKFLFAAVPNDRLYEVLTDSLVEFFRFMITKVSFLNSLPVLKKDLMKMLSHADNEFYQSYKRAVALVHSMKMIDKFNSGMKGNLKSVNDEDLLKLIQEISTSLYFHCHKDVIKNVLSVCCFKYIKSERDKRWRKLVYCLLKHQSEEVRTEVYSQCLQLIKHAFSKSLVSEPLSLLHQKSLLFLEEDILQEIVTHGVPHPNTKISNLGKSLITTALLSRLNMAAKYWRLFLNNITPYLAWLQACLQATDIAFDKAILALVHDPQSVMNVEGRACSLSLLEQIRVSFRLMLLKNTKMRRTGFALSLIHLTEYNKQNATMVNYSNAESAECENLFVFKVEDLVTHTNVENTSFSEISPENVSKLWEIFNDCVIEENLRFSAAEQLAIIFQDRNHQILLIENRGYNYLLQELAQRASEHAKNVSSKSVKFMSYLLSLLKMTKSLVKCQTSIRHILAIQKDVYLNILGIVLLHQQNVAIRYEASCILTYLLFSDLLVTHDQERHTHSLPQFCTKFYKLPVEFEVPVTNDQMKRGKVTKFPDHILHFVKKTCWLECDWFKSGALKEYCSSHCQLSEAEQHLIQSKLFASVSQSCFKTLGQCEDHYAAMTNLERIKLLLLVLMDVTMLSEENNTVAMIYEELNESCGNGFIKRVMNLHPQTEEDVKLLLTVISLIKCAFQTNVGVKLTGLKDLLMSDKMVEMIESDRYANTETNSKHTRSVKQSILSCLAKAFEHGNQSHLPWNIPAKCKSVQVANVILAIYHNLSVTGSESYYDLPLMEAMLGCLLHLLSVREWSVFVAAGESVCLKIFSWLTQILMSFHVDRASAGVSFMGKGIVQKTVTCLCHTLHEILSFQLNTKSLVNSTPQLDFSSNSYLSSLPPVSQLPWLVPLLSDRSLFIRWTGWALSRAFISDEVSMEAVVTEFQNLPGGLWAASLGVLLDVKECFFVRAQACRVLSKLVEKHTLSSEAGDGVWNNMIVQDTNSKVEITGSDAFILLLDHFEFFGEISKMFADDFQLMFEHSIKLIDVSTSFSQSLYPEDTTNTSRSKTPSLNSSATYRSDVLKNNRLSTSPHTSATGLPGSRVVPVSKTKYESMLFKCSILDLLSNLVTLAPHIIVSKLREYQLHRHILSGCNTTKLKDASNLPRHDHFNQLQYDTFCLHVNAALSTLRLLKLMMKSNDDIPSALEDCDVITPLFSFFTLSILKQQHRHHHHLFINLWNAVMDIISDIHHIRKSQPQFSSVVCRNIQLICGCFVYYAEASENNLKKFLTFFILLMVEVFSEEDIDGYLMEPTDSLPQNTKLLLPIKDSCTVGEIFCCVLLHLYNKTFKYQSVVHTALCCLFLRSKQSQRAAYENGFMESVTEELKDVLIKLNMATLDDDEKCIQDKKNELLDHLTQIIDVIRNFSLNNEHVKRGFVACDLMYHLQTVWLYSKTDPSLLKSLLNLFTVLTANCPAVQSTFWTAANLSRKQTLDESPYLHYIIKMVSQMHKDVLAVHGKLSPCLHLCFEVITNTLNVAECRTLLYKSNVFHLFTAVHSLLKNGNKHQRNKAKSVIADWWKLLLALTYHQDGGKATAKIPNFFEVLAATINDRSKKDTPLLIARNSLFVPAIKQAITSNQMLLNTLLQVLLANETTLKTKTIAMSFFWALLYDNQKAKVVLKKMNFVNALLKCQEQIETGRLLSMDGDLSSYDMLKRSVYCTSKLMKRE